MKYVKHILLVFLFAFMLRSVALADSEYSDHEIAERILEIMQTDYSTDISTPRGNELDSLGSYFNSYPDEMHLVCYEIQGVYFAVCCHTPTITPYTNGGYVISFPGTGIYAMYRNDTMTTQAFNGQTFNGAYEINDYGLLSEWISSVDYSDIIYDGTIFAPNFNIQNKLHAGTQNIDLQYVAIQDDNIFNTDIEYYTYIKMYLYSAKDVLIDYGKYTVNSYYKSDPIVIYDYSDLHEDNTSLWLDLNDYKSEAEEFMQYVTDYVNLNYVSGMSAGTQLSRTTEFLTNLNKGFPHFVNGVEIWAQNFYIYENQVYVSNWTKWNSTRYSDYNSVVPVAEDQPANGIKNTETPIQVTDQQADEDDTYNPIGEQTGESSFSVVINNNTPNYPDYPTVASYNHDNLLLQFIQTAQYLPDMFSGYASFLASAFIFIPSGIWTIIGFGFLGSIAVMIIKVL